MLKKICKNCFDYDKEKEICLIRYVITLDHGGELMEKKPMKRKPKQAGCKVFMYKSTK